MMLLLCAIVLQHGPVPRHGKTRFWWICLAILVAIRPGASAGAMADEKPDASLSEWLSGEGLTGAWGGLRNQLEDRGYGFSGEYDAELWGNLSGGLKTGAVYTGLLKLGLKIDLEKAFGWHGATFNTEWLWLSGQDASKDLVGNFLTISNIAGFNTVRNYELWFQQNLWSDALSLRLGQLAADTDFVVSDYAALFLNANFGWPAFMFMNLPAGGPGYPMATLGIRLAAEPAHWFSFQSAVFQGNVYAQNVNLHGFRWRLNSANGFFFLHEAQLRWNDNAEDQDLPGKFKAGAWFHTARFEKSDQKGEMRGNYGFYLILDQMLYRTPARLLPESKNSPNAANNDQSPGPAQKSDLGLGVFCRVAWEPADRNVIGFYFDAGLTYRGLIASRNADVLGIAFAYSQLSSGAKRAAVDQGLIGVGAEMALEATYRARITPWLSVQPDLQYIIHPASSQNLGDALVLGCHLSIVF